MNKLWILFIIVSIIISSCSKGDISISEGDNSKIEELKINENLVSKKPTTPEELKLVDNLKKITLVFKELYKDMDNLKVVNAAILSNVYTDESVLLRDLIYPENGIVATNKKFINLSTKFGVKLTSFNKNFWNEAVKLEDPAFSAFLQSIKPEEFEYKALRIDKKVAQMLDYGEISIYAPYSDNFVSSPCVLEVEANLKNACGSVYVPQITTIVTATADADEGIGYAPYYNYIGELKYGEVVVNDDYAFNNPTQIIGINGIEPYELLTIPSIMAYFPPSAPTDLPDLNIGRQIQQVYVGHVRCAHQYDRLISFTGNGGGSEIRFTRSSGYLKLADGQVQADNFLVDGPDYISRKNIRQGNWVEWSAEWDHDWEADNKEQFFAIYEEDNRNAGSITGLLKTTLKLVDSLTGEGSIGFTLTYKSDDAIIRQTNFKYSSFFALNRIDMEGEMRENWPVYDKNGGVSFTLWDRAIY